MVRALAGLTKQDEIVEIAVLDVETGEEFDSGLISIAESAASREVRLRLHAVCVPDSETPHGCSGHL